MLAGVAGGLAELWDADPSLIRVIWALLTIFTGGLALVVYIVMAIVVPDEDDVRPLRTPVDPLTGTADPSAPAATPAGTGWDTSAAATREARRQARAARRATGGGSSFPGAAVAGGILILLGGFFLAREFLPSIDFDVFWPVILIGLGVVLVVGALRRPGTPEG